MSDKLSASDNPANKEHLCAKQVVHEKYGKGDCIPTMHATPDDAGHVAWYDVMFEHGIECRVDVKDLDVTLQEAHIHSSKKPKLKEGAGMPSKAEVMKHCKDGKSVDDICKMYPDCDADKIKAMCEACGYGEAKEGKMDPVGQEDGDVDNDGDEDESDKYIKMRRKAINKALTKKKSKED